MIDGGSEFNQSINKSITNLNRMLNLCLCFSGANRRNDPRVKLRDRNSQNSFRVTPSDEHSTHRRYGDNASFDESPATVDPIRQPAGSVARPPTSLSHRSHRKPPRISGTQTDPPRHTSAEQLCLRSVSQWLPVHRKTKTKKKHCCECNEVEATSILWVQPLPPISPHT